LASKALIIQCLFALTSSNYSFTAFSSDSVAAGI
jgi:putative component of membrane protein insertase Oxa1/YidC/SpoIIIJ protein YidD